MAERVLRNRRRKASKGKLIRVSDEIYALLNRNRSRASWDCLLRRIFGLPNRKGEPQPLLIGWLEVNTGQFYLEEAEARGASVMVSAKAKTKKFRQPIKMREVVW